MTRGGEASAFRTLYRAFRMLSDRATSALLAHRGKDKPPSPWTTYGFTALLGLVLLVPVAALPPRAYAVVVCTYVLLLVNLAVVADFAAVVVAPDDDQVLFHLPIRSRDYLAARLAVASRHVALTSLALVAPSAVWVAAGGPGPMQAVALLVAGAWTGGFALVMGFGVYRVALAVLGGERTRSLLAYLPSVVSLLVMFAPQALPQLRSPDWVVSAQRSPAAWCFPPFWFAGIHDVLVDASDPIVVARAVAGLAATPLAAAVLLFALSRGLMAQLQRLAAAKDARGRPGAATRPVGPGPLARATLGVRSPAARAGWVFGLGCMRARGFRTRAFSMAAMPMVWIGISAVRGGSIGAAIGVVAVYAVALGGTSLIALLPYHDGPEAAWVYEAFPIPRYDRFHLGVVRALLGVYVVPACAVSAAVAVAMDPTPRGLASTAVAVSSAALLLGHAARAGRGDRPFARPFRSEGSTAWRSMVMLLLMMGVGIVHAVCATLAPSVLPLLALALATLAWLAWRSLGASLAARPPIALRPVGPDAV